MRDMIILLARWKLRMISEHQTKMIDREMKLKTNKVICTEDLKQQEQSIDLNKDSVQMENKKKTVFLAEKDMAAPKKI